MIFDIQMTENKINQTVFYLTQAINTIQENNHDNQLYNTVISKLNSSGGPRWTIPSQYDWSNSRGQIFTTKRAEEQAERLRKSYGTSHNFQIRQLSGLAHGEGTEEQQIKARELIEYIFAALRGTNFVRLSNNYTWDSYTRRI